MARVNPRVLRHGGSIEHQLRFSRPVTSLRRILGAEIERLGGRGTFPGEVLNKADDFFAASEGAGSHAAVDALMDGIASGARVKHWPRWVIAWCMAVRNTFEPQRTHRGDGRGVAEAQPIRSEASPEEIL